MARPEAVAVGGYYKTPVAVVEQIAALFHPLSPSTSSSKSYRFVDPCAGDGEAVCLLAERLVPRLRVGGPEAAIYCAELEGERHKALQERLAQGANYVASEKALRGDAFQVSWDSLDANVLYLNPPYDTDREVGRLEHRFLTRFTGVLRPGDGLLIFIVPHYALEASADFLSEQYDDLRCWRFPSGEYEAFRQVVLTGRRKTTPRRFPDTAAAARVRHWAEVPEVLPPLDEAESYLALPPNGCGWAGTWRMNPVDAIALYEAARPLMEGRNGDLAPVRGLGLDAGLDDLISHRFPVVMPPRPAHVAVALAAGLVNGHRILPDDPASGFPPLMVKGMFVKEYHVVDEKLDKNGNVTSQTAIQQPKLTLCVLRMDDWTYHDLADGATATEADDVNEFNAADLLEHYGLSLSALMRRQCPPLHDPTDPTQLLTVPEMTIRPFPYQQHGITAALKVIFADRPPFAGEHPFVLGEVGTGKTLVAFGTALALSPSHFDDTRAQLRRMGAGARSGVRPVRRMLVMCPPHLVTSWAAEAAKLIPGARVMALERISDVQAALALPDALPTGQPGDGLTIFLLSREYAKLGHAWADGRADGRCPRCGAPVVGRADAIVAGRLTCDARPRRPTNAAARRAESLALALAPVLPENPDVLALLSGRVVERQRRRWLAKWAAAEKDAETKSAVPAARQTLWNTRARALRPLIAALYGEAMSVCAAGNWLEAGKQIETLGLALWAIGANAWPGRDDAVVGMIDGLLSVAVDADKTIDAYTARPARDAAAQLLLGLTPSGAAQRGLIDRIGRGVSERLTGAISATVLENLRGYVAKFVLQMDGKWDGKALGPDSWKFRAYDWQDGRVFKAGDYSRPAVPQGSPEAAVDLLNALVIAGEWETGKPCGERLYQATPSPRRYPLASYINRYAPGLFDLLVLDEAHEYSTDGSAQERAAHRLTGLGRPTLVLTGTSNNGYASSLFMNMWALSRRFRDEFGRDDLEGFVNRYGYRKVKIDPDGQDVTWLNRYGAMSDRVDSGTGMKLRKIGQAPGVLPLFVLRHMLPSAILLQKSDMVDELPPLVEIGTEVEPADPLRNQYLHLRETLLRRIMDDLREKNANAGLLWGQMAQMPTYLDRAHADTGNADAPDGGRRYEIRYPASVGGEMVVAAEPLAVGETTAREEWLLDTLAAEFAEGRRCIVFAVNTRSGLAERLLRLVETRFGAGTATLLQADRVPAGKRMAWIDREVVRARRRALIVNPEAVETGLNNLVYFATAIWFQNPNCSSVTYTQANGRIHRPGQTQECRVYVPYFVATTQETQFVLLGHKVAAARQADGLDVTSALLAAGAGENESAAMAAMSVGQAIYHKLTAGVGRDRSANGHGRPVFAVSATPAPRPVEPPAPEPPAAATPLPARRAQPLPDGPARQMGLFG